MYQFIRWPTTFWDAMEGSQNGGDRMYELRLMGVYLYGFLCAAYFKPVVAMPVVMKRWRKAKTTVIGSRVRTVIART